MKSGSSGQRIEYGWITFGIMVYGFYWVHGVLDRCYHVDLINTTRIVSIESEIEMYHTLLKRHICNLNKWILCKIGLSEYDLDQDIV
jgi:hypothetical protein